MSKKPTTVESDEEKEEQEEEEPEEPKEEPKEEKQGKKRKKDDDDDNELPPSKEHVYNQILSTMKLISKYIQMDLKLKSSDGFGKKRAKPVKKEYIWSEEQLKRWESLIKEELDGQEIIAQMQQEFPEEVFPVSSDTMIKRLKLYKKAKIFEGSLPKVTKSKSKAKADED